MVVEAGGDGAEVVLVVDDDDAFLESLIEILTSAGIRSVGASSVREAHLFQATHLPGVMVVDEQLPDGSGTEFAHTIKEHNPDTVVIVLSAYPTIDTAPSSVP